MCAVFRANKKEQTTFHNAVMLTIHQCMESPFPAVHILDDETPPSLSLYF